MAWTDMTALTGLVAWYKPETLAATYANGDPISTWADSSGNSHDLTGTTTTRPLAAASAVGTYMAADFDGTDDVLSSASYTHSGNTVVAAVLSLDVIKNYSTTVAIDSNTPANWIPEYYVGLGWAGGHFGTYANNSGSFVYRIADSAFGGTPSNTSTNYIVVGSISSLGFLCRTNGVSHGDITSGSGSGSPASAASGTAYIHLGKTSLANSELNGKLAEIIIWTPTTDYSEVPWVEGYLANKYSITLAYGHLFKNAAPENAPTTYNAAGGGASKLINGGLVD